jgi:hypothetical protein
MSEDDISSEECDTAFLVTCLLYPTMAAPYTLNNCDSYTDRVMTKLWTIFSVNNQVY